MAGYGEAISHGAATIVNAIATGLGGALGVDLWTIARVRLTSKPYVIKGRILSEPSESTSLIEKSVLNVLRYFGAETRFGADVETDSNIPIARGLKSSSTAANAIVLATAAALGRPLSDDEAINLGVDAAIAARTTVTGAFDDASASFLGGVVMTDNAERKILQRFTVKEDVEVLFFIPNQKAYTYFSDVARMKTIAPQIRVAFREALSGNYWVALTLNGLLYSAALGYDPRPAIDALQAGAIASGLSGKGPAITAVVPSSRVNEVRHAWAALEGKVIQARVNHEKARVTIQEP
ncbi:MAG: shikimate kinase [Candidatus Bathyarchaeia archaeon]